MNMVNKHLPQINFYIPQKYWPSMGIPASVEDYHLICDPETNEGRFFWTLQTFLYLKKFNFPCNLTNVFPSDGIIIAHRDFLPGILMPNSKQLLVCIKADRYKHPFAQLHIVQNPNDDLNSMWQRHYLPHWPQGRLIPRDGNRGDIFENIAYLGTEYELAQEIKNSSWERQICSLGLTWHLVKEKDRWNDYSYVDAIIAVRSFDKYNTYDFKPASKLINAWMAGVPAVLGCESAYSEEGKNGVDYIEVSSVEEAIFALKHLKEDINFRHMIVKACLNQAEQINPKQIAEKWINFIIKKAIPGYEEWTKTSALKRGIFLLKRLYYYKKGLL
jgi:hypothetical protein